MASTLLDAVRKPETAPASAARAHGYLCKSRKHSPHPVYISDKPSRGLPVYSFRNRTELSVSGPIAFDFYSMFSDFIFFASSVDEDRDVATNGGGNTNPILIGT